MREKRFDPRRATSDSPGPCASKEETVAQQNTQDRHTRRALHNICQSGTDADRGCPEGIQARHPWHAGGPPVGFTKGRAGAGLVSRHRCKPRTLRLSVQAYRSSQSASLSVTGTQYCTALMMIAPAQHDRTEPAPAPVVRLAARTAAAGGCSWRAGPGALRSPDRFRQREQRERPVVKFRCSRPLYNKPEKITETRVKMQRVSHMIEWQERPSWRGSREGCWSCEV